VNSEVVKAVFKKWASLSSEDRMLFEHLQYGFNHDVARDEVTTAPIKRGGRPRGSKNKAKAGVEDAVAAGAV
jgi:hypothetical protein